MMRSSDDSNERIVTETHENNEAGRYKIENVNYVAGFSVTGLRINI